MRVPDTLALSAVFVGAFHDGQQKVAGTGFFITIPSAVKPETNFGYLVTARHCVEQARRLGPMFVRINRRTGDGPLRGLPHAQVVARAGDADTIDLSQQETWLFHEDETNDVAVLPLMPDSNYLFVNVDRQSLATPAVVSQEGIGIGDDVVITGLFASHYGRTRNRPIVRSGIIAAMPDEPIEDPHSGLPFDAYLIEARSIGGLSGSPVWLVIHPGRLRPNSAEPERRLHFYLLGLIRGHWKKDEEWLSDFAGDEGESLNTGIALVTPIDKALDIIDSTELMAYRKRVDREEIAPLFGPQQT